MSQLIDDLTLGLVALARSAHARGWAPATSGNFSAVSTRVPLRLLITASGVAKDEIGAADIIEIDAGGRVARGQRRASAETPLHLRLAADRGAGAVAHTHSPWATLLSLRHAGAGGLALEGWELLKALEGVTSHAHREWVPILDNDQDMAALAVRLGAVLRDHPAAHAVLLRGHGLYVWGVDLAMARRHLEAIEFLLQIEGLRSAGSAAPPGLH